jgi:hypothetical protein
VLNVKILILSDGKYGDRAIIVIKKKFPEAELILLEEEDPTMFLDEVILKNDVELAIEHADLLILYVRHPDVVMEIASRGKPTILAINFGLGFLNQCLELNPKVIMPISMCNALPDTGIDEIDRYFEKFGNPIYKIKLEYTDYDAPIIKNAELIVESPCGASKASIDLILGKEVTPDTFNLFAINIRQECREPVSVLLSHDEMSESSAVKHLLNLLEAIEKENPSLFLPNTPLGEYAAKRREEFKTKNLKQLF